MINKEDYFAFSCCKNNDITNLFAAGPKEDKLIKFTRGIDDIPYEHIEKIISYVNRALAEYFNA